ncbi:MAG TPA: amidohydrolase family protein [Acidobacteriota bacterium]|nr:amidohydrolase family protein [Acidobacteriota bacterium]
MRKILTLMLLLFLLSTLLFAQQKPISGQKPLAFIHVTVIDATGAPAKPDMTVLVTGDRIAAIGKTGRVHIPKDAQNIEATGKFLIPGLWDIHTHTLRSERKEFFLPLYLAFGVTGVRDMGAGDLTLRDQWRKEIDEDALIGPRIIATGRIVDGPLPYVPNSIACKDEAEGRQAVAATKKGGADFVKIYDFLSRNVFLAIADESKKEKIPFVGHLPISVSAQEASDAGLKSMEHLWNLLISCSSQEPELREELTRGINEAIAKRDRSLALAAYFRTYPKAVDSYSREKASRLFRRFARNHTWQCPTLTYWLGIGHTGLGEFAQDPRLKYLPASLTRLWLSRTRSADEYASIKKLYEKNLEVVGEMRRGGVQFLAGTDLLNAFCFPGFSLHDELELLVRAGLTPMEALQSATRNAASFLEKLDSLGTVEKGKIADLVLLDANPLKDISNTRRINAVVVNGRLLDRIALDGLLAQVEARANKK